MSKVWLVKFLFLICHSLFFDVFVCFSALFDLGNDLQQADSSSGTYYLVLATMHVHGDNIKEALIATDSFPNMEL